MGEVSPFVNLENVSFVSYNNEVEINKSQSNISQYSKGFSINDICPDSSFLSESKHQRVSSQQLNYLAPSNLFANIRKPSRLSLHDRKPSGQNHESEELNSTRMQTCQSRRISDYDLRISPIVPHGTYEIQLENVEELKFCRQCRKNVKVKIEISEEKKMENVLVQLVNFLFSCCNTQVIEELRVNTCEECGFMI